jgi:hypothetical protein
MKISRISINISIIYLGYFRIGKVNNIQENSMNITLFHYKLEVKSGQTIQHDVLINFVNIDSKPVFQLNDQRQKILINKLIELGELIFC